MDPTYDRLFAASPERPVRLGRHAVVGRLGEGGMGAVFEAIDLDTGLRVALKVLNQIGRDAERRFKQEYRAVVDLSHDHLVQMHGLEEDDGLLYLTMEKVEGADWLTWVRGEAGAGDEHSLPTPDPSWLASMPDLLSLPPTDMQREPEREAAGPESYDRLRIGLSQLLEGLEALHGAGHLHLDLKPSNVMVEVGDGEPRVVLLDFGLTKPTRGPTVLSTQQIGGTPPYMAPEQATDEVPTAAADVYGVGVLLFEALTGRLPFETSHPLQLLLDKAKGPKRRPSDLVDATPADLDDLTMAMLKPDPADRPRVPELLRSLGAEAPPPHAAVPFVGRTRELKLLTDLLEGAREAHLVEIHGLSGTGKSALVDRFLEEAREKQGAWYLRGRCYQHEQLPHKGFDQVIDRLASHLRHMPASVAARYVPEHATELVHTFPVFSRVPALRAARTSRVASRQQRRRRAYRALSQILGRIASKRALVVAIDDLHWADEDTLELLRNLLAATQGRVLFVTTRRELDRALHLPLTVDRRHTLRLDPMGASDGEELARRSLDALGLDPAIAPSLASHAAGIPFFTLSLARAMASGRADGCATLDDLVGREIQALSVDARAMLDALAVDDATVPLDILTMVANTVGNPHATYAELTDAHLATALGTAREGTLRLEMAHARLRSAVTARIDPASERDIHVRFFRAYVATHGSPPDDDEQVDEWSGSTTWLFDAVRHALAGVDGLLPEERSVAVDLALRACEQGIDRGAYELSVAHAHHALTLIGDDPFESDVERALDAAALGSEAAHLRLDAETSAALDELVLTHATQLLDRVPSIERCVLRDVAHQQYERAVRTALEACRELGLPVRRDLSREAIDSELYDACKNARRLAVLLDDHDACDDPKVQWAQRLLTHIYHAAHYAQPDLQAPLATTLVNSSARYGLTSHTAHGLAALGTILITHGRLADGIEAGRLAARLLERLSEPMGTDAAWLLIHTFTEPWDRPPSDIAADLRDVRRDALREGDLPTASHAVFVEVSLGLMGETPLDLLAEQARSNGAWLRETGADGTLESFRAVERLIAFLTGTTAPPDAPTPEDPLDSATRLAHTSLPAAFVQLTVDGLLALYRNDPERALYLLVRARDHIDGAAATLWMMVRFQAELVARAELARQQPAAAAVQLPFLHDAVARLTRWAEEAPRVMQYRALWARAELARLEERPFRAEAEQALLLTASEGNRWDHAQLLERFATPAEAIRAYRSWGAAGMADQLQARSTAETTRG